MKKIAATALITASLLLAGCVNGYQQFYKSYAPPEMLQEVEYLKEGEQPQLVETTMAEMERSVRSLRAKGYIPMGYSSFNGQFQNHSLAVAQAKRLRATVVLVGAQYTDTQKTTTTLALPNTSTTYSSGSVYGGGVYGAYSGTSTTQGTSYVPITTQQRRFDQGAVFFVKTTKKYRFGINVSDIPVEQRAVLGRNVGAIAELVLEGTPAFYANIIDGDLIEEIDGVKVKDGKHALELMGNVSPDADHATFKLLRAGTEKTVRIELNR